MDIGIKELGITLMVGAFTILGFEAILHYFFDKQLTGFFQGKLGLETESTSDEDHEKPKSGGKGKKDKDQTITVAVFLGLAFAIGIIAEDLSYKYVDSVQIPFKTIPSKILPDDLIHKLDLPSKYDSRISTLVETFTEKPKPQWLAVDLARSGAFFLTDPDNGLTVQQWMQSPTPCTPVENATPTCPSIGQIQNSILKLYYYAKNRVYADQNYYDELKKIQARIEFSRSLSLIAFVYFSLAVLMAVILFLWTLAKRGSNKPGHFRPGWFKISVVVGILCGIYVLGTWAYERESDEFNKRTFGYFSSMLISEQQQQERLRQQSAPASTPSASTNATPQTK